jgi:hypothetical protein
MHPAVKRGSSPWCLRAIQCLMLLGTEPDEADLVRAVRALPRLAVLRIDGGSAPYTPGGALPLHPGQEKRGLPPLLSWQSLIRAL